MKNSLTSKLNKNKHQLNPNLARDHKIVIIIIIIIIIIIKQNSSIL